MKRVLLSAAAAAIATLATLLLAAEPQVRPAEPQVRKESVAGITNLARLGTTVACAGAVTPAAIADVKKMGHKAVFNFRLADEPGADIEAEASELGTIKPAMKQFALDYLQAHGK